MPTDAMPMGLRRSERFIQTVQVRRRKFFMDGTAVGPGQFKCVRVADETKKCAPAVARDGNPGRERHVVLRDEHRMALIRTQITAVMPICVI